MDVPRTPSWQIKLRGVIGSLGAQERRFAEYLLNSFAGIEREPIAVLAKEAQVSEATVVRVCHKMGYSGLKELKIVVARESETAGSFDGEIGGYMDELKERVFLGAIRSLQDTMNLIDENEVERATEVLCNAKYISIYGVGGSVPVARSLKHQLMKLRIPSNVYNEFQPAIIAAEKYNRGDVAIGISHSGESSQVVEALRIARGKGATTICITSYGDSAITHCSDMKFFTTSETLLNGGDNSLARIAQTSIINLLYLNVALKYNRYHQAGEQEIQ
ncbi:MAG: MurR/RpiR family transcriptional regulator [Clostridium sp.]|nr:MurR/RpiR family transcriptional regulator [Clostridium sp.]